MKAGLRWCAPSVFIFVLWWLIMTEKNNSAPQDETFSIGELAKEFGITLRSIRFYEDQGLISPMRQGLTRIFSRKDRARLALICRGKRLGFSIRAIKTFLDLYEKDGKGNSQLEFLLDKTTERITLLSQQLVDIQQTLKELAEIKTEISAALVKGGATGG